MTGFLTDYRRTKFTLPQLMSWDISHGWGEPCDGFEVSFLYTADMLDTLYNAVEFSAVHEGKTVFSGRVDEYEITADENGLVATVRGRGFGALLLDNQCEAAQYGSVGLESILRNYVTPVGITRVLTKPMKTVSNFTVSSGSSYWTVLKEFCRFAGSITPRFSADGVLILDGSGGEDCVIDRLTPVTAAVLSDCRYGVVSRVLVKNKSAGTQQTIDNTPYLSRGALAGRVVNVPRRTGYDAMRFTGQYQIENSVAGKRYVELTLPALFAAFPGDRVSLAYIPMGLYGNYMVCKSRCWADKDSAGTVLTLEKR